MEIRCDRCHTECKVEGTSLGARTSVRCGDCGNIIVLGPKTPSPDPPLAAPAPAANGREWHIETVHGRSLRAPDLATLHRWIIERRVTREDRICSDGSSWQRVGEVPDLVPFFDIVDSAERARRADTPGPMLLPPPPAVVAKASPPLAPVMLDRGAFPEVEDRTETKLLRTQSWRNSLPVKLGLTTLVTAAVAYAGIAVRGLFSAPAPAPTLHMAVTPPPVPAPAPPPAPQITREPVGLGDVALAGTAAEAEPVDVARPALARKRPRARAVAARPTKVASAAPAPSATASGSPQAAAAQGYAALNHRQYDQAIVHFRQALSGNPSNGTALFGLAEAYRESGQKAAALKVYRRYVQLLPSGPDAGSARLQIRLLEGKR